jgi:hypothetical protein
MFLFFAFSATQVANEGANSSTAPNPGVLLYISLAFGFSLAVNVWCFYRITGGIFNPAVRLPQTRSMADMAGHAGNGPDWRDWPCPRHGHRYRPNIRRHCVCRGRFRIVPWPAHGPYIACAGHIGHARALYRDVFDRRARIHNVRLFLGLG